MVEFIKDPDVREEAKRKGRTASQTDMVERDNKSSKSVRKSSPILTN